MITQLTSPSPTVLAFQLSGKLHDDDYKHFVPTVDDAVAANGPVRMLVQFHDFHGWDLHALWDDSAFAIKHINDITHIALVGEKTWEKWMATICKPFTRASVKYFDQGQVEQAWAWLCA